MRRHRLPWLKSHSYPPIRLLLYLLGRCLKCATNAFSKYWMREFINILENAEAGALTRPSKPLDEDGWMTGERPRQQADDVDAVENFLNSLPLYQRNDSVFIKTENGDAALSFKQIGNQPTVEIHWLAAIGRGSGRAAMSLITKAADENGITLRLDAVPMDAQGEGKTLSSEQLEKFYGSFGFVPYRRRGTYPSMRRKPNLIRTLSGVFPPRQQQAAGIPSGF
jgi:hypothetical protein